MRVCVAENEEVPNSSCHTLPEDKGNMVGDWAWHRRTRGRLTAALIGEAAHRGPFYTHCVTVRLHSNTMCSVDE